ncbi:MAG: ABC transporter permease [Firmicutes bacterium]|nr:ABC transporter permease [Bacillota bacterium]
MTIDALTGSIELGMIYAILALGVFLSFRTLNTPDLTVDGSIVTGAAASAMLCTLNVHPLIGLAAAFVGGACAGAITALLNTKLKIQPLLAGILVMLGVYSINLRIMGGKANLPLTRSETIYTQAEEILPPEWSSLAVGVFVLAIVIAAFFFFLKTRLGFALRATGDNEDMVRAAGISSDNMKLLGLSVSNGFVGLAGGLLAQYQGYSDIGMGVGMVVIGLASVIIGEVVFLFGSRNLLRRLIAVALGAVLYRLVLAIALNLGMQATDMKLVSAIIVIIALSLGVLGESFSLQKKKKGAKNA